MIFITGDCHGDFYRFGMKCFPKQTKLGRDDYMIICGDFGRVWNNSPDEQYWLAWLDAKPWTTLWIGGNHENYDMLKTYPVEDWHGGKVRRIRPNILYLMRGQLYEIGEKKFFTMGGAQSHDVEDGILDPDDPEFGVQYILMRRQNKKRFRIKGISWWPEEMPSDEEYAIAMETLERAGWKADYVITHCAPTHIAMTMSRHNEADKLTDFLELVSKKLDFQHWFFGHYHDDRHFGEKYVLLYEQIIELD